MMNTQKKAISTLGTMLVVGFFCLHCGPVGAAEQVKGGASEPRPAEEGQVLASYGDTKVVAVNPVKRMFRHADHVIEAGLHCDNCHPNLFPRKYGATKAKGEYRHSTFDKGLYCGACHDGKSAFDTKRTERGENCRRCHGSDMKQPDIIVFTKPAVGVAFAHKGHVNMGLECSSCHDGVFEMRVGAAEAQPATFTMQAIYAGKYCGLCHNGTDAFAANTRCTLCHVGVKGANRQATSWIQDTQPMPNPAMNETEPTAATPDPEPTAATPDPEQPKAVAPADKESAAAEAASPATQAAVPVGKEPAAAPEAVSSEVKAAPDTEAANGDQDAKKQ